MFVAVFVIAFVVPLTRLSTFLIVDCFIAEAVSVILPGRNPREKIITCVF